MAYEDPLFSDENKAQTGLMKFNKIGDAFKGTLIEKKKQKSTFNSGEMQNFYKFIVHGGEYHNLDENKQLVDTPVSLAEGSIVGLWGKPQLDDVLLACKLGQIVGIRLSARKAPAKPGNYPTNVYWIYPGGIDPNYMGQGAEDMPDKPDFMNE